MKAEGKAKGNILWQVSITRLEGQRLQSAPGPGGLVPACVVALAQSFLVGCGAMLFLPFYLHSSQGAAKSRSPEPFFQSCLKRLLHWEALGSWCPSIPHVWASQAGTAGLGLLKGLGREDSLSSDNSHADGLRHNFHPQKTGLETERMNIILC